MKKKYIFFVFILHLYGIEIKSIQADFIQSNKSQPIFYEGKFIASTPNLAKWEYTQPLQKTVYVLKNKIISYEPTLSQVIIKNIEHTLDFIAILSNAKQDSRDPHLFHSKIADTYYTLYFQNNLPYRIEYQDQLGQSVMIELKNVKINFDVDKKIFEFIAPSGIDVIEQ